MRSFTTRAMVVSVLVMLAACSGQESDPGAAAEPSTSPAETDNSESPEPSPTESEEGLPAGVSPTSQGTLEPGNYQTSIFEPSASFSVTRGWQVPFEGGNHLVLARKLEPRDEVIYLDSSQQTADVDAALEYAQDAFTGTTGVARDFRFSNAAPVRIGDSRGRSITMEVRTDQLVVTLALGIEAYEVRPGDRLDLKAIDVDGRTILVFVEAPGSRFKAFLEEAEPVLASLAF